MLLLLLTSHVFWHWPGFESGKQVQTQLQSVSPVQAVTSVPQDISAHSVQVSPAPPVASPMLSPPEDPAVPPSVDPVVVSVDVPVVVESVVPFEVVESVVPLAESIVVPLVDALVLAVSPVVAVSPDESLFPVELPPSSPPQPRPKTNTARIEWKLFMPPLSPPRLVGC
jgi:hypothetical protein